MNTHTITVEWEHVHAQGRNIGSMKHIEIGKFHRFIFISVLYKRAEV